MWIDADELDEKAFDSHPDQIERSDFSHWTWSSQRFLSVTPEVPEDERCRDGFVEWRRVNTLPGWYKPVGKTHSPRQGGRRSVVAIAGSETSNSANCITDCRRGRTYVQNREIGQLVFP